MQGAELTNVSKIQNGDEIINLGIVEKVEHAPISKISSFTITNGKCISAAFYWYRWEINLWVVKSKNNEQPTVHNS